MSIDINCHPNNNRSKDYGIYEHLHCPITSLDVISIVGLATIKLEMIRSNALILSQSATMNTCEIWSRIIKLSFLYDCSNIMILSFWFKQAEKGTEGYYGIKLSQLRVIEYWKRGPCTTENCKSYKSKRFWEVTSVSSAIASSSLVFTTHKSQWSCWCWFA